ncbi:MULTISPECIES: hypothetical protein [unclassified Rhizobium]|uniref:hypothetical protein n=1 Tax=unclassified Rhizobium TaxID=2613769 RepID=UPI0007E96E67|nr:MULTISPECIES: hypothetical protein [unclassified Rhizobium]ANM13198.1 hypothetical protein AMK05_PB00060 [Rhizobium sp. N324]ANM19596.1 hypothetical protein AMK06_PB00060 [Rhizobium sp. N541]ANM25981.1 hypothetical protein AMK07_PB00060 [Rhizobium sp. N941]OYD00991.1 hypothetical protein AMK08_PB00061 [Rhizobium sp. N4311]
MNKRAKTLTGTNERPENETIAQSGFGIPDDSGPLVEPTEAEIDRVKASRLRGRRNELKEELDEQTDLPQRGAP